MLWLWSFAIANPWNAQEGQLADELLLLDSKNEWISARNKAEELLLVAPDSYTGHHVLGRAYWMGEGDFARAAFHLKRSLEIYQEKYEYTDNPAWRLESEGWYSLRIITGDMGDFEQELELIEQYNQKQITYRQRFDGAYMDLIAERGWPLMKLGRYEEAKKWARQGIASGRNWQESLGWNVLCATAGEQGFRAESIDNCEAALFHARASGAGVAIDASNASNAAFGVFDFDRAEEYAIESTKARDGSSVSAWMNLVFLYLMQGRGGAAVSAMQGLNQALASEKPNMRAQKRADVDGVFALLLMVAGKGKQSFEKIDRAVQYPDRRGTISTSEEQSRGSHTCVRYVARKVLHQRVDERIASMGWWDRVKHWWDTLFGDPELVIDAAGVRNALNDKERLISTFRPFLDKGLTGVPPWMLGDIVEILGPGVAEGALLEAQKIDSYAGTEGFYSSIQTEIAYQRGSSTDVLKFSEQAMQQLPLVSQLMRARLLALQGWAYERKGNRTLAVQSFAQAMEKDPSVFRRIDLSIPTKFPALSGFSAEIVNALRRSPRLTEANSGFSVQIEEGSICLLGPSGEMFSCAAWPVREDDQTEQEYLVAVTEAFHIESFGLTTGLTGAQWNSLDGTTTSSTKAVREQLENMLAE
jgi:tetratricopeptide (TPR) repeat protein